jgi:phosphinothricin acetyltransferase
MITIRAATTADAPAMLDIYSSFVLSTAISFETAVPAKAEMEARIERCLRKFPWIVCEIDRMIAGYAYASSHRERDAYQWTCESSIYLHPQFGRRGIGMVLYTTLLSLLKLQGFVNVYGGITLPNEASIKLHEKCGFVYFAGYDNVGYKLDSWHKVGWWKLQLNEYHLKPTPPLPFFELDEQLIRTQFEQAATAIQSKVIG